MNTTNDFFKFARDRHRIYLKRKDGVPRPWTTDPILNGYKFTNVYRELDKTTQWFKFNVRDPLWGSPEVFLATVLFRWFNRIPSGEAMFRQLSTNSCTAFENFERTGETGYLRTALRSYCGDGPYFTGAYMIRSPTGINKLDGMLSMVRKFWESDWKTKAESLLACDGQFPLEELWKWLKEFECQGPFHAYEVITDLRHTKLLYRAPDIMTWANPGPGARRGVGRFNGLGRYEAKSGRMKQLGCDRQECLDVMRHLLKESQGRWPKEWPAWEMREVEHTLCEWDKYERMKNGQGKMKGRYP